MIKNITEAKLAQGYQASHQYTYEKLMDSTSQLHPFRKPYTTMRMVNNVEGIRMRREWQ